MKRMIPDETMQEKTSLDHIADILPPTPPVSSANEILIFFIILTFLILLSSAILYFRSDKQQLKRLIIKYQHKKINQRKLAQKTYALIKQISIREDKNSHELFYIPLQAACFSRNGIEESRMTELIQRVEKWI